MIDKIERDYIDWLEEQVKNLKAHSFEKLDVENLIEELEALVRSERSAVKSFAYQIILHLLLVDCWKEESQRNKNHWNAEIISFQFQLNDRMTTNLKNYLERELDKIYAKARKAATAKTGLSGDRFPENCPYTLEKILSED